MYNTDYLRTQWGFQGYVTGDCGAVADVLTTHHYTTTTDQTCYDVINSGLDTDCGSFLSGNLQKAFLMAQSLIPLSTRLSPIYSWSK